MTIFENGQLQTESEHFKLIKFDDYLPVETDWWLVESEQVYEYISRRINISLDGKVVATFRQPETSKCAARGKTYHEDETLIILYANADTGEEQLLAVLAHEISHGLIHRKYPRLNDAALIEGMSTWAAGDYWESWKGLDFKSAVIASIGDGTYLPISQNYDLKKAYDDKSARCLADRDLLLTEWASFLDFLKSHYGEEKLTNLFDSQPLDDTGSSRIIHPPDYQGVYGLELNQLEHEWLQSLLADG